MYKYNKLIQLDHDAFKKDIENTFKKAELDDKYDIDLVVGGIEIEPSYNFRSADILDISLKIMKRNEGKLNQIFDKRAKIIGHPEVIGLRGATFNSKDNGLKGPHKYFIKSIKNLKSHDSTTQYFEIGRIKDGSTVLWAHYEYLLKQTTLKELLEKRIQLDEKLMHEQIPKLNKEFNSNKIPEKIYDEIMIALRSSNLEEKYDILFDSILMIGNNANKRINNTNIKVKAPSNDVKKVIHNIINEQKPTTNIKIKKGLSV